MSIKLEQKPMEVWYNFLKNFHDKPRFLESSDPISGEIKLSKRELLGLIIYSYKLDDTGQTKICWDDKDVEPNDGYLELSDDSRIRCEHKIVSQYSTEEDVISDILATYSKYAKRGKAYGLNRHLIIHTDRESKGLLKISRIHDEIKNKCVFDKVFTVGVNGWEGNNEVVRFSFTEQYPNLGIEHIKINIKTGELLK